MLLKELVPDYQTEDRMKKKLQAIPLPELAGKTVLDVGCDMGFWSRLSVDMGASRVVGIDRGREVRGVGFVELAKENSYRNCQFIKADIGKQWPDLGEKFDVIYLFSLYHHIFQNTGGDHAPIWFWLYKHLKKDGILLFEGPLRTDDPVVQLNVDKAYHENYCPSAILESANRYFRHMYIGPALHEPTREVYSFTQKWFLPKAITGQIQAGAGGATKAFLYAKKRRIKEIEHILGFKPTPGSLNTTCIADFWWNDFYFRAQILDVKDRSVGLDSEWVPRWCRFYPVKVSGEQAFAMRFEGERYPAEFVELIAPYQLRELVKDKIEIASDC